MRLQTEGLGGADADGLVHINGHHLVADLLELGHSGGAIAAGGVARRGHGGGGGGGGGGLGGTLEGRHGSGYLLLCWGVGGLWVCLDFGSLGVWMCWVVQKQGNEGNALIFIFVRFDPRQPAILVLSLDGCLDQDKQVASVGGPEHRHYRTKHGDIGLAVPVIACLFSLGFLDKR